VSRTPHSKELLEFLSIRLGVPVEALEAEDGWVLAGNTIGSLAIRLGVLSLEQVEQIVHLQPNDGHRFGELAVALGYASPEQIERLLILQHFHRCLDLGGRLLLSGHCEFHSLLEVLTEFAQTR